VNFKVIYCLQIYNFHAKIKNIIKAGDEMAERSKRIELYDNEKIAKINPDTIKLLNKYKIDMTLRELSEKTIESYIYDLYNWFTYIYDNQANQCITELTEDDLTEFFYFCKTQGNNSRRIKRRMASISALYKYLRKKRIIAENPMEFIDRPQKDTTVTVQTFLTKDQVDLMIQKLDEAGDLQLKTYALLSLSTMARVNAVSNIIWGQVDFENRTINDVLEKEGKIVTLYFSEVVKELLLKLKQEREEQEINSPYIFITKYNNRIDKANVSTLFEWCKKVGRLIDVPTLHPHDFRHSGSMLLKVAGMPIETISELLNHSGLDVTKKHYLTQDKQKIKAEKDKYQIL
jgi:site-specific recombinase XerD